MLGAAMGLFASGMYAGKADLSKLADPTRPATEPALVAAPVATTGPVLQSILISPTRRRAVINGRTYKIGDKVDGAVVADIQSYEVTLRQGQRETRLRLFPRLVKEPNAVPAKKAGKDG